MQREQTNIQDAESSIIQNIQSQLLKLKDTEYKKFNSSLIPTLDPNLVMGVRTPALRTLARELEHTPLAEEFLKNLPHTFFEENQLHAFLIERCKDYQSCLVLVEEFLPYVDNWATCDQLCPKVFASHREELLQEIPRWLVSEDTYTIRFAIKMLMSHYLDQAFKPEYLDWVAKVESEEYYVNMMAAWYFATALAKQPQETLPYIEEQKLPSWVHNPAIQKAVESRRITPEQKDYLRTLKRRNSRQLK